jgi:four helix bundle protein
MTSPQARPTKGIIRSHRDLIVWQRSKKLVGICYTLASRLPPSEEYDLCRQLKRASVSVAANIAEGHGRLSRVDYARHVSIARGSLTEVECLLELAEEVGYLESGLVAEALKSTDEIGRMLWALARSLGSQQLPKSKKKAS